MNFLKSASLAALIATSAYSHAATEMHKKFTDAELVTIMKNDGYSAVSIAEEGILEIKIDGKSYMMLNNDDGDLQAYYGFSGANVTTDDINEWNKDMRLSRAYLDDDKDPILEADLLANAGLTEEHVTEFLDVFVQSVNAYRNFIYEHQKDK